MTPNCIIPERLAALDALILGARKVAVVAHTHPDGDALGSAAGMAAYLQQLRGKEVSCLFPDTPPVHLQFILPSGVAWYCLDREAGAVQQWLREADLVILQDCNAFSRTEGIAPLLEASTAPKVLIDHHLNPDLAPFSVVFSTPEISSASELVYWILTSLAGSPAALPMEGLTALLCGMTTDTNNFANSTFPSTFQMASELIAAGVDRDAVLQKIYNSYRENRVRVMGYMQSEGLQLLPEGGAYMILTREIQERFGVQEGETEGLVNIPLTIGSIRLSALIKEEDARHFRVSLRSKKGTSAQQCAQRFFHGGGHENAAGGKLIIGTDIASSADAAAYVENALKASLS